VRFKGGGGLKQKVKLILKKIGSRPGRAIELVPVQYVEETALPGGLMDKLWNTEILSNSIANLGIWVVRYPVGVLV
jgi:hypothetical protein